MSPPRELRVQGDRRVRSAVRLRGWRSRGATARGGGEFERARAWAVGRSPGGTCRAFQVRLRWGRPGHRDPRSSVLAWSSDTDGGQTRAAERGRRRAWAAVRASAPVLRSRTHLARARSGAKTWSRVECEVCSYDATSGTVRADDSSRLPSKPLPGFCSASSDWPLAAGAVVAP